jgi:hypothetical protein
MGPTVYNKLQTISMWARKRAEDECSRSSGLSNKWISDRLTQRISCRKGFWAGRLRTHCDEMLKSSHIRWPPSRLTLCQHPKSELILKSLYERTYTIRTLPEMIALEVAKFTKDNSLIKWRNYPSTTLLFLKSVYFHSLPSWAAKRLCCEEFEYLSLLNSMMALIGWNDGVISWIADRRWLNMNSPPPWCRTKPWRG